MGSCMSSNGTINVQRYNPNKNNNKSIGCFTSLCKGEDNLVSDNKNSSEIVPNPQIKSSFLIKHNEDKLNNDLDLFIQKYKSKIILEKINFLQIYNIFMAYKYNFTKSDYLICDTREDLKEKNKALFLRQFPQINYNIKQLEILDKHRLDKFFRFIKNKKIIFILKNSKEENPIEVIEKFVIFFLANQNKLKIDIIYILSQFITQDEKDEKNAKGKNKENELTYNDYIYDFIDEDLLYIYSPKILINSSDIKSANFNYISEVINNSFLFFDIFDHSEAKDFNNKNPKFKLSNKFDINHLSNKETIETDVYLNFIYKFKIIYIMNFIVLDEVDYNINKKNSKYIWHCESKRNKALNEDKKTIVKQKNILIPKNMEFMEYYKIIHNEFIALLEELKDQMINNNCVLLQFDNNVEYIFMWKLIYLIIFKITGLNFDNIVDYLKINFADLNNEISIKDKKDEFINILV